MKILIVEDEELLLNAIQRKLEKLGHNVIGSSSVQEAYSWLSQNIPEAIWLDYYLKEATGDEFIKKVKADQRLVDIPIIVVSNSASAEHKNQMLALGADKYLLKAQHKIEDIAQIISEVVQSKSSTDDKQQS